MDIVREISIHMYTYLRDFRKVIAIYAVKLKKRSNCVHVLVANGHRGVSTTTDLTADPSSVVNRDTRRRVSPEYQPNYF
jgi:hypothetical protein